MFCPEKGHSARARALRVEGSSVVRALRWAHGQMQYAIAFVDQPHVRPQGGQPIFAVPGVGNIGLKELGWPN